MAWAGKERVLWHAPAHVRRRLLRQGCSELHFELRGQLGVQPPGAWQPSNTRDMSSLSRNAALRKVRRTSRAGLIKATGSPSPASGPQTGPAARNAGAHGLRERTRLCTHAARLSRTRARCGHATRGPTDSGEIVALHLAGGCGGPRAHGKLQTATLTENVSATTMSATATQMQWTDDCPRWALRLATQPPFQGKSRSAASGGPNGRTCEQNSTDIANTWPSLADIAPWSADTAGQICPEAGPETDSRR